MFNCGIVYDIYKVDEVNHLFDEIDLNGNYERTIDWEIGKWIWGMSPSQIDVNKLKPIE